MYAEQLASMGQWSSVVLSLVFLSGVCFYLFRLFSPGYMRRANGYYDGENEFWHGICLLGMSACLTPSWLPVPQLVWLVVFPVGFVWYLVRGLTYGKHLTYNKQWYDFAHAAMLFGMWWMYAEPTQHWLAVVALGAYWLWFGSYYAFRLRLDFSKPSWLAFGQDGAHFLMAVVMFIMTVWPSVFHHHGQHQSVTEPPVSLTSGSTHVSVASDSDFQAALVEQIGTTIVLVSGGCQNCATEVPLFEEIAAKMTGKARFVRVHKDTSPAACKWLGATQCPVILIVKDGKVVSRLDGFADHEAMEQFINKHLDR